MTRPNGHIAPLVLTASLWLAGAIPPNTLGALDDEPATEGWSPYAPVRRPSPPAVAAPGWTSSPVDAFVFARLARAGLRPAPAVGRREWLRRVTFDLTGLPPTPDDIEAFLTDPAADPQAYAKVVDRLLASPEYGEQKARLWLDVVRYADTDGYAIDGERFTIWRYRDYVIRSWNEDRPFDAFTREQIAGDVLPAADEAARTRGMVAASFLRLGPWEADNMVPRDRRQDYLNEITSTTGTAFLGLTIGCARCHNHKYDPIRLEEYYSLQAFFAATQRTDRAAGFGPDELPPHLRARKATAETERARRAGALEEFRRSLKDQLLRDTESDGKDAKKEISDEELDAALGRGQPFSGEQKKKHESLKSSLEQYTAPRRFEAMVASVEPLDAGKTQKTFVLRGGDLTSPGKEVTPGFITALGVVEAGTTSELARAGEDTSRRRRLLAEWLASSANPLTPRVIVNRIWQQHFVQGLVATANNFGKSGSGASHPELLDFLAAEFVAGGWRSKPIHRILALSRAYRSSRAHPEPARGESVDPENRLLWRAHPRRLAAEELRDAMLSVSGRLNRERGGPGFCEELPAELGTKFPFFDWSPSGEDERRRRSIYHFQRRNLVLPFFEVFDACNRSEPSESRGVSVVAPQALTLLNGRFAVERSLDLAHRIRREAGDEPGAQIRRLFELALGRLPDERERGAYLSTFEKHRSKYREERAGGSGGDATDVPPELRALSDLCLVTLNTNEFIYLD